MHILVVHNFYRSQQPSGEDMVVRQEIEMLRDAGHQVQLFSRQSDDIASFSIPQKIALLGRISWSFGDQQAMSRLLDEHHFDVIHLHNSFPLISPSVLRSSRQHGVPVVMTLHNYRLICAAGTFLRDGKVCTECLGGSPLPSLIHGCYRESKKATLPLTISIATHKALNTWSEGISKFIVMSEFANKLMQTAGTSHDQLVIKPHFIPNPETLRVGVGEYGLYLGRLSVEKGVSTLLEAWNYKFGKLVIIGDGPLRAELEKAATKHGTSVTFLGSLPRSKAMRMLTNARYLVNSSQVFETFGLSVVEAFAHGVPAIVPDQGVFPELVSHGDNGLVFNPSDITSLTSALDRLSSPDESRRMGAAARMTYEDKFTPEQNIVQLEEIYFEAIADRVAQGLRKL